MESTLNKNKEKKMYYNKLLYKAPDCYETYKRMLKNQKALSDLSTSRTSLEGISDRGNITTRHKLPKYNHYIHVDIIPESKIIKNKKIKINLPYLGYLDSKGYPFTSNEQRFKWQNTENYSYPTGINTFQKSKKHIKIKYNNQEEFAYKRGKKFIFSESNDNSFNRTQRVINAEINEKTDDKNLNKTRKKINLQKFLNVGGISNLIKNTPLKVPFKGVKRIKRKFSYELNLFGNDYPKFELPKTNKKHFLDKNHDNDIFNYKNNKSMDNIKKDRFCFKKNNNNYLLTNIIYRKINNVNNYNNFYGH